MRVLLVGPWRAEIVNGCCAATPAALGIERSPTSRHEHNEPGQVLAALRRAVVDEVEVELVDPRNTVFLLPAVYRDARRAGRSRRAAVAVAVRSTAPWTLIADGHIVSTREPLFPDSAIAFIPLWMREQPNHLL